MPMTPPGGDAQSSFWPILVGGLALATFLPIGVHTLMLDVLGVPYPSSFPHEGLPILPDQALLVLGAICLDAALRRGSVGSGVGRAVLMFLTIAALNQALFRLPLMRNVVSTRWTIYPFIDNLPEVLKFAAVTALVIAFGRLSTRLLPRLLTAGIIAAAVDLVFAPAVREAFAETVAANAGREGDQLYSIPYDWHVDVPSYLTYVEPAAGALVLAFAMRRSGITPAWCAFVIFALQGGPLFRLALNVLYAHSNPLTAVLSESQFTLEAVALAIIAVATSVRLVPGLADQAATGPQRH